MYVDIEKYVITLIFKEIYITWTLIQVGQLQVTEECIV